ncbi:hypothetical protein [Enterovirga sp. CN4-39]|uniref:hypothetical protein n=1 Tax=Enterovirga sp. CN4-39 TaxID=3400910 RepID=UPI003C08A8B0
MHRTWTHIRRLVASFMLVAFVSFVLHGSAMARIAPMHPTPAVADHHHDDTSDHHHHGPGADSHGGTAEGRDHHGSKGDCCGSFCATAIAPVSRDAAVSLVETTAALPSFVARGHGILHEGPRKPPRTPDIA